MEVVLRECDLDTRLAEHTIRGHVQLVNHRKPVFQIR